MQRGLNIPEVNPVLNHTKGWREMLDKAAARLLELRPTDVAEE